MTDPLTDAARTELTRAVLAALNGWGVLPDDQRRLLGLPEAGAGRRGRRDRLRLPDEPEVWVRVALLLRVHDALHQIFPHSGASADLWVTTPRAKDGHRTPLDLMLSGGLDGIRRVERSLDNLGLL